MFYPIKSLLLKVTYSSKNILIYPLYLYTVFDGLHTLIYLSTLKKNTLQSFFWKSTYKDNQDWDFMIPE